MTLSANSNPRWVLKPWGLLLLKALLTALFLWLAWQKIPHTVAWHQILKADPWSLAACATLAALQIPVLAARWKWTTDVLGAGEEGHVAVAFTRYAALMWASAAVSQVLPAMVAGDGFRMGGLRLTGFSFAQAAKSVLTDRFLGLGGLVLVAIPGIVWGGSGALEVLKSKAVLISSIGLVAAITVAAGCYWLKHLSLVRSLFRIARKLLNLNGILLLLTAALGHCMSIAVFWLVAKAIAIDLPLTATLFVLPWALLVAMLPISIAGWGVREFTIIQGFALYGVASQDALLTSLLFGISQVLLALPAFLLIFVRTRHSHQGKSPIS